MSMTEDDVYLVGISGEFLQKLSDYKSLSGKRIYSKWKIFGHCKVQRQWQNQRIPWCVLEKVLKHEVVLFKRNYNVQF